MFVEVLSVIPFRLKLKVVLSFGELGPFIEMFKYPVGEGMDEIAVYQVRSNKPMVTFKNWHVGFTHVQ